MAGIFDSPLKSAIAACALIATTALVPATAAEMEMPDADSQLLNPTPIAQLPAVSGVNFQASVLGGVIGGYSTGMFIGSVATPFPFAESFGAQLDLGLGLYRGEYTSAAGALHLFWRDPSTGMLGLYGDWAYVNPEHAGRVGVEAAVYNGQWSLDGVAGVAFGQDVDTEFFDEIDLNYYFTNDFMASIGQRYTTRGNVANVSFEYSPGIIAGNGWSVFGQAEAGQDDYYSAWLGLRYSFGASGANSLLERDRQAGVTVRIPRNIASVTRCGEIPNPANYHQSWNGFETHESGTICGSQADLDKYGAIELKD